MSGTAMAGGGMGIIGSRRGEEEESAMVTLGRKVTSGTAEAADLERALGHRGQVFVASTIGGLVASFAAAPFMTVIDMAIARGQVTGARLREALRDTMRDILYHGDKRAKYMSGMGIMAGVYSATYLTANYTKSICDEMGVDYKLPVATSASLVNVTAIAWKERQFAKLSCGRPAVVPLPSYLLFGLRDCMTITGSFVVKNRVRDILEDRHGMSHRRADLAACFIVPMAVQVASAPLHILSYDLYRRPGVGPTSRLAEVARTMAVVASGRVLRIIPAYGVAGFLNDVVREAMTGVEEHDDR